MSDNKEAVYAVREVVGVFHNANRMESAIDRLQLSGLSHADINVMASHDAITKKLGHHFQPIETLEDDPSVPQAAFVSSDDLSEAKAAVIGLPLFIGGIGGAIAVAASGGALALAIAASAAGGLVGGGLGALIAKAIGQHHAQIIERNLASGGLLLWVCVKDSNHENKAIDILKEYGAVDIHAHDIERTWGVNDVPLHDWQPDPLLEKD